MASARIERPSNSGTFVRRCGALPVDPFGTHVGDRCFDRGDVEDLGTGAEIRWCEVIFEYTPNAAAVSIALPMAAISILPQAGRMKSDELGDLSVEPAAGA